MAIADIYNLDFKDCVESAYNEIVNRKGEINKISNYYKNKSWSGQMKRTYYTIEIPKNSL